MHTIASNKLAQLFILLKKQGYAVIAPALRDAAIIYDEVETPSDLPVGWTDAQSPGSYRLKKREDDAYFGYAVGPHSWKKVVLPPRMKLWAARREEKGFTISDTTEAPRKLALIGVRACELYAMAIQDTVFIKGDYVDPFYKAQREKLFIVAVNCAQAAETCFCVSMKTGPKAETAYDLALTEVIENKRHYFVAEAGSRRGAAVLAALSTAIARPAEKTAARQVIRKTAASIKRTLDTDGLKTLLYENLAHPRWNDVAERCLTCGNCTMVCPTCFCTTVEEITDLTGDHSEHWRRWDSCFTMDFSFIHGEGSVRSSNKSRYRQWMTHKLASWHDQFGSSGCVGCGRCITWCPPGIDITEEVKAIRKNPA